MPNLRAAPTWNNVANERPAAVVRCPGCGRRATLARDESAVARCGHCMTPLMTYRRRFDLEHSVRERLYGSPRRGVDATVPSHGASTRPITST
jgi:ribosomal protein L37AE/L43A